MPKPESLGQFEQLVLGAVKSMDKAYAIPIQAVVQRLCNRPIKFAAVYTALERLEEKGYVSSRKADPTPERGNKPKKYYAVEPAGDKALQDSAATATQFLELMRSIPCDASPEALEPQN